MKRIFLSLSFLLCAYLHGYKIIGLVQVKNEGDIIEYTLRALACNADGIIVLDDNSEDDTIEVIERIAPEIKLITIIRNSQSEWLYGSEVTNRQKLLDAGRKHGGTHFIEIDADEIFTTHCSENNWLRKKLLSLKKGQILQIPIINLWKEFGQYRSTFNDHFPDICYCSIGYYDDGVSDLSYNLKHSFPGFLHFGRFPNKRPDGDYPLSVYEPDINRSIIHIPFINWTNVIVKKVWIMMLEIVRLQEKLYNKEKFPNGRTIQDVSNFYSEYHNYDTPDVVLSKTPESWLNYPFFNEEPFKKRLAMNKLDDIQAWIDRYGKEYFDGCPYVKENLKIILEV